MYNTRNIAKIKEHFTADVGWARAEALLAAVAK